MSTIKVNNIVPPNVGEGVSIDGLQMPTAGPLSNRNLIINGAMQVAQRGTSSTVSGYGSVDRFRPSYSSGTITQTQESTISTDTPYSLGFRKYWRTTNTAIVTTLTTSHRRMLSRIEAQDIANSGWDYTDSNSYITLSLWVRSSVAQTFNWFMKSQDGTEQTYPWAVTLAANTWTKVEKSFPGNSNLTFDNNNDLGFMVDMGMWWGTNYTDTSATLDQWNTYSSGTRTKPYDSTWATTTNATFDMTGVQLEVGSKATPFEHESYGQTLAKCQRYYYKDTNTVEGSGTSRVTVSLDTIVGIQVDFPVTMRAAPVLTVLGSISRQGADTGAERVTNTRFVWGRKKIGSGTGTVTAYATGGFEVTAEI